MARRAPTARRDRPHRAAPARGPSAVGMPSREDVLALAAGADGAVNGRDVLRAFGLPPSRRGAVEKLLGALRGEGLLAGEGRAARAPGALPPVVLALIEGRDADGELLARPASWDDANGPPPRIVVDARGGEGGPAPGVGDRALLRLAPDGEGGHLAAVVKVLPKRAARTLGLFRRAPGGGARVEPIDKRARGREYEVPAGAEGGAREGELVAVEVERGGRLGLERARVVERLGDAASERAVSMIAVHAHDIPHVFPADALAEAEAEGVAPAGPEGREDWRDLPLVTIDPADAKDHDDAVHARPDDDPANPGGHVVTVAIADVAAYVRPGGALDREALLRGNSVYFPDRVVPMLPERLSNDLLSLREREDRPALAVRMVVAADGAKRAHSFHRVVMRSHAKLAYERAQAAIDGRADEDAAPLLIPVLRPLWAAYGALRQERERRGPLALDLPERRLVLDAAGAVERVVTPPRLDAHRLIEEFMILANVCAAETLEQARRPLLYRAHGEPAVERVRALGEFLETLGLSMPKAGALRPALFNRVLERAASTDHAHVVSEVVLRSQAQAEYTPDNEGHFGLNLRRYAHFTSPIRRYADLVVHRALIGALGLGDEPEAGGLREVGKQVSAAERRAMIAERETVDRLIAHHLSGRVGATFEARVGGVTRAGLFVRLDETGADGFVPIRDLGDEYFRHDEAAHALVGQDSGEAYRLGDPVTVRLVEAAPAAGALRFDVLSKGRRHPGTADAPGRRRGAGGALRGRRYKG